MFVVEICGSISSECPQMKTKNINVLDITSASVLDWKQYPEEINYNFFHDKDSSKQFFKWIWNFDCPIQCLTTPHHTYNEFALEIINCYRL